MQLKEIQSVGVEMEGGYCTECFESIEDKYGNQLNIEIDNDGSVSVFRRCPNGHEVDSWDTCGEIKAWTTVDRLPKLFSFVKEMLSGCMKQNGSCGNHVHVSFKKTTWDHFMNEGAWKTFAQRYRRAFPTRKYINRLFGEYCQSDWQSREYNNECDCYENCEGENPDCNSNCDYEDDGSSKSDMITWNDYLGTVEFRILPHFRSADEAIRSYSKLLVIVERMAK